ncbi:hypothetical protein GDO81_006379 [Engystomops pustulosus]|uniref:Uncharacterized protein n=1 Tax=Engystomops pustulosus TaxID=76066 RepID=A0AAV7CZE2_ENGPU|nr:hypothetical protein GDO81_006379 [Engystomops pustulosus]
MRQVRGGGYRTHSPGHIRRTPLPAPWSRSADLSCLRPPDGPMTAQSPGWMRMLDDAGMCRHDGRCSAALSRCWDRAHCQAALEVNRTRCSVTGCQGAVPLFVHRIRAETCVRVPEDRAERAPALQLLWGVRAPVWRGVGMDGSGTMHGPIAREHKAICAHHHQSPLPGLLAAQMEGHVTGAYIHMMCYSGHDYICHHYPYKETCCISDLYYQSIVLYTEPASYTAPRRQ